MNQEKPISGGGDQDKNVLFLLIDALRFDTVVDPVARKFLFPNLAKIADSGFVNRVVTNAQSTQFVLPSIFSLTYPLDHGGYDTGIRLRPKSFIETLKENGWTTHKLETMNQLGLARGYDRGFDTVRSTTDFRVALETYLDRTLGYQVELWKKGELPEAEAVEVIQREFGLVLENLDKIWKEFDHSLWPPTLRKINERVMEGLAAERRLLDEDPVTVMNKVAHLSGAAYWRFLGDRSINRLKRFLLHAWGYVRHKIRVTIATRTFPPFFLYTQYTVVMPDIIDNLCQFVESKRGQKWMAYLHILDVHDCRGFNRPLTVIARWRFLPRWWVGRIRGYTDRRFAYDTALMSVDANVGKLLDAIKRSGQADNLLFLVTGDHGSFYARSPRIHKGVIATRTHFEDIETPMIISGAKSPANNDGLIDSMGMTATLLEALGVEPHPSFKGVSAYAGGREAIISESCGHGAADLARRDLHFTVTTKTHRMMTVLSGTELSTSELYDIEADSKEMNNLADDPQSGPVIAALLDHIHRERAELLALRGINVEGAAAQA